MDQHILFQPETSFSIPEDLLNILTTFSFNAETFKECLQELIDEDPVVLTDPVNVPNPDGFNLLEVQLPSMGNPASFTTATCSRNATRRRIR